MKKLTPEQLSLHLSHGDWVAMKYNNGKWKVFMYERPNGNFQGTYAEDSIEKCLAYGLAITSYPPKEITQDFTEYQIIKRPPVLMKEGDKCQIIDSPELREILTLADRSKIEMIGQKGFEIYSSNNLAYEILKKDNSIWYTFPHWAVARDFSEEEGTLSGKEVIVTVDGKEYTAVIK